MFGQNYYRSPDQETAENDPDGVSQNLHFNLTGPLIWSDPNETCTENVCILEWWFSVE